MTSDSLPVTLAAARSAGWVAVNHDEDQIDPTGFMAQCRAEGRVYVGAYVAPRTGLIVIDVNGSPVSGGALRGRLCTLWGEILEEREPGRFLGNWISLRLLHKRVKQALAVVKELSPAPVGVRS